MKNIFKITLTIFISISFICCTIKSQTTNDSVEPIISFKNDSIEYSVFETSVKTDAENDIQCKNYLSSFFDSKGFEINGADFADLYSQFFNIEKQFINLKINDKSFYNIVFKGTYNDSIKKALFQKIAEVKNIKISQEYISKEVYVLDIKESRKLDQYLCNLCGDNPIVKGENNKYHFKNCNFTLIVSVLNQWHPNKFFFDGDQTKKYNIKIPTSKDEKETIQYLKDYYDIKITLTQKEFVFYTISPKNKK